jgi:hypothetical protein
MQSHVEIDLFQFQQHLRQMSFNISAVHSYTYWSSRHISSQTPANTSETPCISRVQSKDT